MIDTAFMIETPRTKIRPFRAADCPAMLAMLQNPMMTRYTLDEPWTSTQDYWIFYQMATDLYRRGKTDKGFRYFFGVEGKAQQKLIGYCGLGTPAFDPSLTELFYAVDVPYWKQGYATEIGEALLEYGFIQLGCPVIVGYAQKQNLSSIKVLEKIGMISQGTVTCLQGENSHLNGAAFLRLDREDYLTRREGHQVTM